jgi:hypothetical protein
MNSLAYYVPLAVTTLVERVMALGAKGFLYKYLVINPSKCLRGF